MPALPSLVNPINSQKCQVEIMALSFDDMSLPIKFNISLNDDQFEKLVNGNENNEWAWDLADFYSHYFDQLDFSPGDTIQFNEHLPLILDSPESE